MDKKTDDHEDEEGEDFIDLEDISIYDNDPDYEPTEEEVVYYAERLGFDVENDPNEFLSIAYQALKAPLPENWRRALIKSKDELVYINLEDQTIHLFTDIDEMAYKYYVEEKEKWVKSKQEKESRQKVVPRAKIPPLNSVKNKEKEDKNGKSKNASKKKKEEDDVKKLINSKNEIKKDNKNSGGSTAHKKQIMPDEIYENIENNKIKEKHENIDKNNYSKGNDSNTKVNSNKNIINDAPSTIKDPYNISTKFDLNIKEKNHKTLESDNEEFEIMPNNSRISNYSSHEISQNLINNINQHKDIEKYEELLDIKNLDSFDNEILIDKIRRNENIIPTNKSPKKVKNDINNNETEEKLNTNFNINKPLNKSSCISASLSQSMNPELNLDLIKKEYFNEKLREMKEYETKIREDYNKGVEEYKQMKNQIKINFSDEYERKIALNKRKIKDEFEALAKYELINLEKELEENYEKIIQEYQPELEITSNNLNNSNNHINDNIELIQNKIFELENQKKSILEEIEFTIEMKEKQNKNILQSEISDARNILEEKYKIEKNNLTQNYNFKEKEMESEEEEKYNKEVELIQKKTDNNIELQEKSIKSSHSKLLDDYGKALDEDYTIQCKTILREFEDKHKKETFNYKSSMEREKEEKIILFKKEILQLEKSYYSDLNMHREENKNSSIANDKKINSKFENVLNTYEVLKKNINSKTDVIFKDITNSLRNIIESQEINEDYFSIESKFEEYIISLIDDYLITTQRKRASYEILEVEYKEKSLFLDYYIDIGSQLVKLIKQNPTKRIDKETNNLVMISSVEEKIYEEIVNYTKEKQREYKIKYSGLKEQQLFQVIENLNASGNNLVFSNNFNGYFNNQNLNKNYNQNHNLNSSQLLNNKNIFNSSSLLMSQNIQNIPNNNKIKLDTSTRNNDSSQMHMQNNPISNFNINKSINIKNEHKVPLSSDRYSENIIEIHGTNRTKLSEFEKEEYYNNNNNNLNYNQNLNKIQQSPTINPLYLTFEVISKLDGNDKSLIEIINEFIMIEQERLTIEFVNLNNHKKIYENLKNTIESVGLGINNNATICNDILNLNSTCNNTLINYIQIIEDDKEKIKLEERNFTYQKNIYDKIESLIEDCFIYIRNNIIFETKKEIINDKLMMIKNQIEEYYEAYSKIKKIKLNNSTANENKSEDLNGFNYNNGGNNIGNINNSLKIGNSTDFFISQKLNKEKLNGYTSDNSNNTLNNFYNLYNKRSLNEDIFLPTSNSFLRYKKSKNEIDTKLDLLKNKMTNSSYHLYN